MKDKFDIFTEIIYRESNVNHYGIYICIGQFVDLLSQVDHIYNNWEDALSLKENVDNHFDRSISPLGSGGHNRL